MENNNYICEALRLLRIANNLSIQKLSNQSGLPVSYISDVEKGIETDIPDAVIKKYSQELNVKESTILFFKDEKANSLLKKLLIKILRSIV